MVTIHLRLRTLIYFALVVLAVFIIWKSLFDVVLLLLVSAIFLAAIEPIVERIENSGLPRGVAVLAVMLIIASAVALVGFLIVPALFTQITDLVSNLPNTVDQLRILLQEHGLGDQFSSQLDQFKVPGNLAKHVLGASTAALSFLVAALTVVIVTTYLILDARRIDGLLYDKLPRKYHHHARYMLATLQEVVGGYIRGQVLTSAIITGFAFVLLLVLRVPNPLPLALIAGVGDVIPVVGVIVIVAPLTLAALTVSVQAGIIVAVAMVVYVWVENNILVPRIYGETLSLPPLVIFLSLIVGGKLLGFAGALLSLPLAAALRVAIAYAWDIHTGRVPLEIEEQEESDVLTEADTHADRTVATTIR
ncbi:MAG: AI-2E family transporter [Thermomicrobiales bacterium]